MATMIHTLINGYKYFNENIADPRTNEWFLIRTPWPVLAVLALYCYFLVDIGPRLMKNRNGFNLTSVVQIYDFLQIVLNSWVFYRALTLAWLKDYSFQCEPIDTSWSPKAITIATYVWYYHVVKILDLWDTVFFVLRKKENHVSFLHVYHHAGMVFGSWVAVKYFPGGHITSLGLINTFVHTVMYSYYLISTIITVPRSWKKHITQLQIFQFVLILIHFSQLLFLPNCAFPKLPILVFIPQLIFMIVLFGDFYYNAYVRNTVKNVKEGGPLSAAEVDDRPKKQ